MTISEQIKVLCVRSDISVAELARRIGTTPQNFSGKMKRESFTIAELEDIAGAVNSSFERKFVLKKRRESLMHENIKQNDYSRYASNRDVISLFSGAMGLDIGLGKAGLNVVIGQDFDAACVKTMKANGHKVLGGDIREIQPQQLLDMAGLSVGEPFLICGGPPCQPFSTAGKRLGINDPRGSLFMDFIRMIDYIRPRFFVMENVKGIMSSPLKHVPLSERDESDPDQKLGTVLDVILSEFGKLGYKTVYGVLDAVNYGVPQFRERFVLIGSRDDEDIFLPIPTHFQMHQDKKYQWQTVRNAIEDLESDRGECAVFSEERLKF